MATLETQFVSGKRQAVAGSSPRHHELSSTPHFPLSRIVSCQGPYLSVLRMNLAGRYGKSSIGWLKPDRDPRHAGGRARANLIYKIQGNDRHWPGTVRV